MADDVVILADARSACRVAPVSEAVSGAVALVRGDGIAEAVDVGDEGADVALAPVAEQVGEPRLAAGDELVEEGFDQPLLLIAAGSGVTPVMSILKTALATSDSPIVFFYANRSSDDVIFAAELRELHAAHSHRNGNRPRAHAP